MVRVMWNKIIGILLVISGVMVMKYEASYHGYPPIVLGIEISENIFGILSWGQIILGIVVFFIKYSKEE